MISPRRLCQGAGRWGDLPRSFKAPGSPLVPSLSAIVSLVLMLSLPGETWARLFVWMGVGVAITSPTATGEVDC